MQCLLFICIAYSQDLFIHVSDLFIYFLTLLVDTGIVKTDLITSDMKVLHLSHIYVLFSVIYR